MESGNFLDHKLAQTAARFVDQERAEIDHAGNEAIFNMARDKVLDSYKHEQAENYEMQWLTLSNILQDAPLSASIVTQPSNMDYIYDRMIVPGYMGLHYEKLLQRDGADIKLRTHVYVFTDKIYPNGRRDYEAWKYKEAKQALLNLRWNLQDLTEIHQIEGRRSFTVTETGLEAEKIGFMKYAVTKERQHRAITEAALKNRKDLLDTAPFIYAETIACPLGNGDPEVLLESCIARSDFVPEEYDKLLPTWKNGGGAGTYMKQHPVFKGIRRRKGYYQHMINELPKYIPSRDKAYATMAEVMALLTTSDAVESQSASYFRSSGYLTIGDHMNVNAGLKGKYADPY
jgi:hypothetical protein